MLDTTPQQPDSQQQSSLARTKSLSKSIRVAWKRPRPNACLLVFYAIQLVTIGASLCLLATQLIPIIVDVQDVGCLRTALRIYVACLCILFALNELQVPLPFLQNNPTFQGYISRGLLYSFVGLIGMEQSYSTRMQDYFKHASSTFHIGWTPLFMQISSWLMVCVGYLYVIMGILCMQSLKTKLEENYKERLDAYNRHERPQEQEQE